MIDSLAIFVFGRQVPTWLKYQSLRVHAFATACTEAECIDAVLVSAVLVAAKRASMVPALCTEESLAIERGAMAGQS